MFGLSSSAAAILATAAFAVLVILGFAVVLSRN
jgi:hypothetical protein